MPARARAAVAGVVVMTAPLLVGQLSVPPAEAVVHIAEKPKPGKKSDKPKKEPAKPDKGKREDRESRQEKPKRDRKPPVTPVLGGPGVGPGGSVSLPIIAESGASVVVAEVGGPVVATGTGVGGYSSLSWTTSHGQHSYSVTATDRAGNRSETARTSVFVDALPPRLGGVRVTPGTPSDTRSRLRFTTDAGSAYRVLVDGRPVAFGRTTERRAERLLDIANGRHRVQVVVRDVVGNPRSAIRPVAIRIPKLAVRTRLTSEPTERTQAVRVRATPTARRGVIRFRGQPPVRFAVPRGSVTIELDLPDGTYPRGAVMVRDSQGRSGRATLPALTVDTSPPTLDVVLDDEAAAEGSLRAAVTAEDDAELRWQLLDASGAAVTSGELVAEDGEGVLDADVDEGSYRLVATATDAFDRTTAVETPVEVADDPVPTWLVLLFGLILTVGGALALAGLVLLLRWARRPDNPVRPALAAVREAAKRRLRPLLDPPPDHDAAGSGFALFDPEAGVARMPQQRLPDGSRDPLPPDDQVLHRTPVRVYQTTEERDDGPILGRRTGVLVLARQQIAVVDDRTGEVWSGRIAALAHVGDDTSVVLPAEEDGWLGLVYGDRELTRPVLDLVAAHHAERPLAPAGAQGSPG